MTALIKLNVDPSGMVAGAKKGKDALKGVGVQAKKTETATERMAARSGTAMKGLGTAMMGLVGVAGGMAAAFKAVKFFTGAVNEAEKFQTAMNKVRAIVKATGGAAGRSADQLREQARQIAFATLESTEGVLKAQQTLLTFRGVQGEVFDRAIADAADLASAMGVGLNSAVLQLGKALEDPITGMTALTRSGTVFTEQQKAMVRAMVEAGNKAEAQRFILSELEKQYSGTARAAASGLAGSLDTLSQRFQEMKLAAADSFNLIATKQSAVDGLSAVLLSLTNNMDGIQAGFASVGVALEILTLAQIPRLVTGLYALATAGGVATGAMGALGAAVTFVGGPLSIVAGILAAAGLQMFRARQNADDLASALKLVTGAQDKLGAATTKYYSDYSTQSLTALRNTAALSAAQVKAAMVVAQTELSNASFYTNFFGFSLFQTKRMAAATKSLEDYKKALDEINKLLAVVDVYGAKGDGPPTDAINAAQAAGEKMLADLQDQMTLQSTINVLGEDSSAVAWLREKAERATLEALLDQKGVTGDLRDQILAVAGIVRDLKSDAEQISFQRAASTAGQLAKKLGLSLQTASKLLALQGGGSAEPVLDPRDPRFNKTAAEMARIRTQYNTSLGGATSVGTGGGGGAAPFDPLAAGQKQIDTLRAQAQALGLTSQATAVLTAKNQLLAQAQQRGVDLNQIIASSGLTVREVIERQAESIGTLQEAYKSAQEQAQFFDSITGTLKDGLIDAIVSGDNFADTLGNVAKMLEKAAFQALLFGQGPLANLFGTSGGGLLGGLFGNADGNVFRGGNVVPFARGGVVNGPTVFPMARGAGLMGEAGPEAVMPLKRGTDGKLGVVASGGGGVIVQINNYTDQKATATRQKGPNGREIIKVIVGEEMSRGSFDGPQKARYGATARRVKR